MFEKSPDERLEIWAELRRKVSASDQSLHLVNEFWSAAPRIIHNTKIDPYNPKSWPTPWEILYENKYDDFTIALMMGYTLKLSDKHKNDKIEIKTMVDSHKTRLYNLVYVNDTVVLNYDTSRPVSPQDLEELTYLENLIEVIFPR